MLHLPIISLSTEHLAMGAPTTSQRAHIQGTAGQRKIRPHLNPPGPETTGWTSGARSSQEQIPGRHDGTSGADEPEFFTFPGIGFPWW